MQGFNGCVSVSQSKLLRVCSSDADTTEKIAACRQTIKLASEVDQAHSPLQIMA
jgi:hypothetical protein